MPACTSGVGGVHVEVPVPVDRGDMLVGEDLVLRVVGVGGGCWEGGGGREREGEREREGGRARSRSFMREFNIIIIVLRYTRPILCLSVKLLALSTFLCGV